LYCNDAGSPESTCAQAKLCIGSSTTQCNPWKSGFDVEIGKVSATIGKGLSEGQEKKVHVCYASKDRIGNKGQTLCNYVISDKKKPAVSGSLKEIWATGDSYLLVLSGGALRVTDSYGIDRIFAGVDSNGNRKYEGEPEMFYHEFVSGSNERSYGMLVNRPSFSQIIPNKPRAWLWAYDRAGNVNFLAYELEVREANCINRLDDDNDGKVDIFDEDCSVSLLSISAYKDPYRTISAGTAVTEGSNVYVEVPFEMTLPSGSPAGSYSLNWKGPFDLIIDPQKATDPIDGSSQYSCYDVSIQNSKLVGTCHIRKWFRVGDWVDIIARGKGQEKKLRLVVTRNACGDYGQQACTGTEGCQWCGPPGECQGIRVLDLETGCIPSESTCNLRCSKECGADAESQKDCSNICYVQNGKWVWKFGKVFDDKTCSCDRTNEQEIVCEPKDSDGGMNPDTRGTCQGLSEPACTIEGGCQYGESFTDYCGPGNILYEYVVSGNKCEARQVVCKNGCGDGRCLGGVEVNPVYPQNNAVIETTGQSAPVTFIWRVNAPDVMQKGGGVSYVKIDGGSEKGTLRWSAGSEKEISFRDSVPVGVHTWTPYFEYSDGSAKTQGESWTFTVRSVENPPECNPGDPDCARQWK